MYNVHCKTSLLAVPQLDQGLDGERRPAGDAWSQLVDAEVVKGDDAEE
jgi:hypothetical protein